LNYLTKLHLESKKYLPTHISPVHSKCSYKLSWQQGHLSALTTHNGRTVYGGSWTTTPLDNKAPGP